MNLSTLESIVGPINRGQLAGKFKPSYEEAMDEVPTYFSDDRRMAQPPPLTEDLSHLNPKSTGRFSRLAKRVWNRMTPEERKARTEKLAKAGKVGGSATKGMRHLRAIVVHRRSKHERTNHTK